MARFEIAAAGVRDARVLLVRKVPACVLPRLPGGLCGLASRSCGLLATLTRPAYGRSRGSARSFARARSGLHPTANFCGRARTRRVPVKRRSPSQPGGTGACGSVETSQQPRGRGSGCAPLRGCSIGRESAAFPPYLQLSRRSATFGYRPTPETAPTLEAAGRHIPSPVPAG